MAAPLPEPEDDHDRKLLEAVADVGWAVVCIPEDEEGPGYAFSVGLYRTFDHPEVILIGQSLELAHHVINNIGADIEAGKRYEAGREYDDLLDGYAAAFVAVDRGHYREYLGTAGWFYRGDDFPVVQLVWPDRGGAYPWSREFPPGYWRRQPVLGDQGERGA